jgi:hypothetical protein
VMYGSRKSGGPIVPAKLANAVVIAGESMEGRGPAKGNEVEQNACRTLSRTKDAHSALDRVRQRARRDKKAKFTALLHHVTLDRLRQSYLVLKRGAAAGVDGVTWHQYGENLEENLRRLHERVQRGAYRVSPTASAPGEDSTMRWTRSRWG